MATILAVRAVMETPLRICNTTNASFDISEL